MRDISSLPAAGAPDGKPGGRSVQAAKGTGESGAANAEVERGAGGAAGKGMPTSEDPDPNGSLRRCSALIRGSLAGQAKHRPLPALQLQETSGAVRCVDGGAASQGAAGRGAEQAGGPTAGAAGEGQEAAVSSRTRCCVKRARKEQMRPRLMTDCRSQSSQLAFNKQSQRGKRDSLNGCVILLTHCEIGSGHVMTE